MGFVLLGMGRANPSQEKLCDWVVERAEILLKNSSLLTPLFFCVGLDCKQQNEHQREEGRFLCWNKVAWHEVTVGVQGNTAFKNRHVTKFSPVLFQLLLTVLLVFLFVCFFFKVLLCKISIQRKSSKHKSVKICFHIRSSLLKFMAGHCGFLKCLRTKFGNSFYPTWKLLPVLFSNHTNIMWL